MSCIAPPLVVRRIAACAVLLAFVVPGASSPAADLVKFRVNSIPIVDTAPFYAAIQEGYFTDEGLDVSPSPETTGAVGIPGAIAGSYDVVYSNVPTVLLAIQQGLDLRVVAMGSPNGPPNFAILFKRRGEPIKTGKDLEGKLVAVNDTKGLQWMFVRGWVKANGGNPDQVNFRAVPIPLAADALRGKQVDAIFAVDPFLTADRADPTFEILGYPWFGDPKKKLRVAAWVATGDFVQAHPDLIRKFDNAMAKGARWVNANLGKDTYVRLVSSFTKMDQARVASLPLGAADTKPVGEDLRRMAQIMRDNGLLTADFDPAAKVFVPR
jgi:NitT/TauT family transport system substrate-binding protein